MRPSKSETRASEPVEQERRERRVRAYCAACGTMRELEPPRHPSGVARCRDCGARIDLADYNPGDVEWYWR